MLRRDFWGYEWLSRRRGLWAASVCLWRLLPCCAPCVFSVPWPGGPAEVRSPGRVPAGVLAAGLLLALAVTPGHAQTHFWQSHMPACPPFSAGWWPAVASLSPKLPCTGPELPVLLSLTGWVTSYTVRCCGMGGRRDESEISLGTNVKLNKMRVCISQPKPDCAI